MIGVGSQLSDRTKAFGRPSGKELTIGGGARALPTSIAECQVRGIFRHDGDARALHIMPITGRGCKRTPLSTGRWYVNCNEFWFNVMNV